MDLIVIVQNLNGTFTSKKTDASGTESKVTFTMLSRVEWFSKDAYRQKIK